MRRFSSFAGLALLCLILLNACHSTPKHAKYIPKDASVVIGLNTGALSKKVAWSMITGSKLLDDLKEKAPDAKGKTALDDISNAGIDWMNTLYFYARPDSRFDNKAKMSLIVPLDDAAKWEAFIKKTYPAAAIKKVKDRSEVMLDDKMYAAWTSNTLIMINAVVTTTSETDTIAITPTETVAVDTFGNPSEVAVHDVIEIKNVDAVATAAEMEASFNLPKDAAITDNNRFVKLEKEGHDVSVFVAYDALMDNAAVRNQMMSGMGMMLNNSLWKNSAMATGIDFENGKIVADMLYYPSDSMRSVAKEMGKEEVDNDMLGRIPGENLNMAMGYHLSPEALKMILDKMGLSGMANLALMQKGLSVDEILGAFTGDMAFSLNDFSMEKAAVAVQSAPDSTMADAEPMSMPSSFNKPKMNLVYAIKIKDKTKLDKLLNLLKTEMELAPVAPNTYIFPMGSDSIVALVSDKYIVVSNKMATAQTFLQAKGNTPELVKKEISGHTFGMAMDFKTFMAKMEPGITGREDEAAMMNEMRNLFASASMNGGEFKSDGSNYHMELNFVNTKENSLLQILNFVQHMNAAQKKNAVVLR